MQITWKTLIFLCLCFASSLSAQLNITVKDMRLPTVQEWAEAHPNESTDLLYHLQAYHDTAEFHQSWNDFKKHPHEYFSKRIVALSNLIQTIEEFPATKDLLALKQQALNKKEYLHALPDPLNKHFVKDRLFALTKAIPLSNFFLFEKLDPLHRFGQELYHYINGWRASFIPNYFIFLETVEYHLGYNTFAPFTHHIVYLTSDEERAKHKIEFRNGSIYHEGKPLHTLSKEKKHNLYVYVLGLDGEFYACKHKIFHFHHSSLFGGETVLGAGEIIVNNGKIELISNISGHYIPHPKHIFRTLEVLYAKYGPLTDIKLELMYGDIHTKVIYNAQEYLDTRGQCAAIDTEKEWSPLHHAIHLNRWEIAHNQLEAYKHTFDDPKFCNPWRLVSNKDFRWYQFLLDAGVDPLKESENPFQYALKLGNVELFEFLWDRLSETKQKELLRSDIVFLAACSNSIEMVEHLLHKGVDFSRKTSIGQNIMHYAAIGGIDMLQYFERKGYFAYLYERDFYYITPLHAAISGGCPETIEYLMAKGLKLTDVDYYGNTALHMAIDGSQLANAHWLLSQSESFVFINAPNNFGVTPLHTGTGGLPPSDYSAMLGYANDINMKDQQGLTPLNYLCTRCLHSHYAKINLIHLLEKGANIKEKDNEGLTAWQHLINYQHVDLLSLMLIHTKDLSKEVLENIKKDAENKKLRLSSL